MKTKICQKCGVKFYTLVHPLEKSKYKPPTAYTVFVDKIRNGTIGKHKLTETGKFLFLNKTVQSK